MNYFRRAPLIWKPLRLYTTGVWVAFEGCPSFTSGYFWLQDGEFRLRPFMFDSLNTLHFESDPHKPFILPRIFEIRSLALLQLLPDSVQPWFWLLTMGVVLPPLFPHSADANAGKATTANKAEITPPMINFFNMLLPPFCYTTDVWYQIYVYCIGFA